MCHDNRKALPWVGDPEGTRTSDQLLGVIERIKKQQINLRHRACD